MPVNFPHAPLFERRGLMLDISRNRVPTITWLKTLIDALAALHYNELQLYTEHTFAYSAHETAWAKASPMTAAEIREIDYYCAERGIELVPNQNSFGHMERWLRHEAYKPLAECPDGFEHPHSGWRPFGSTLYPGAESLTFLNELYTELLPQFRSTVLNVGGDEPWELGKERSAERVKEVGKHRVYLDFMKQVFALAEQHGHKAQFWADIILERPDLVPELPDTVTPVIWGYEADSPFETNCKIVAEAGFTNNFYVAPGAGNWNSFSGRLHVARANIQNAATAGQAHHAKGLLLTAWGDNGHHQPSPTLFAPLVIAAYAAHGEDIGDTTLAQIIDTLFYSDQAPGHGAALIQLGQLDALLPQPAPPSSFLHSAFFAKGADLSTLRKQTTPAALETALTAINALDSTRLDPEITLGLDLNRFAAERCLDQAPTHSRAQLKQRFAEQWLRHYRNGGLEESLCKFDI